MITPHFAQLLSQADALYEQGDIAKGTELYVSLLQMDPENPAILNAVATSLLQRGHAENAIGLLKKALYSLPGDPGLLGNLDIANLKKFGFIKGTNDEYALTPVEKVSNRAKPNIIHLLPTSRCNLNCTYCGISGQASDRQTHQDMDADVVGKILDLLAPLAGSTITLSGGEVTFMKDWISLAQQIKEKNFKISLISNFAKLFSDEEIKMLVSFSSIAISMDSPDATITKHYRSKLRLEILTLNLIRIRAYCLKHELPLPALSIASTVGTPTLHTLPDLITFAHACGVNTVSITDVTECAGAPGDFTAISRFDRYSREESVSFFNEAIRLANRLGVGLVIEQSTINALNGQQNTETPPGLTKSCLDPWQMLLFKPNGDIHSCCVDYPAIANISHVNSIKDIFFSEANLACKQELLSGALHPACKKCTRRQDKTPDAFINECQDFLQVTH